MRIPATRLAEFLTPGLSFEVRKPDSSGNLRGFCAAMPYTEALALACRGHVEGIAAPSGRLKYLCMIPESERPSSINRENPEPITDSRSTIIARTKMGAYREAVESSEVDPWGMPTRIIIGHIWQLHGVSL